MEVSKRADVSQELIMNSFQKIHPRNQMYYVGILMVHRHLGTNSLLQMYFNATIALYAKWLG